MSSLTVDRTTQYAKEVVSGEIVAGKFVRLACQRHLDDLDWGYERGLSWDVEAADRAMRFFPAMLTITGGEKQGEPFELLPWHVFVVGSVFGWKDENGLRRFRFCWVETGKGQAKSPLFGAIAIYLAGYCGIHRAEVYCIGEDKNTAKVMFRDVVSMLRAPIPGKGGMVLADEKDRFRTWGKGQGTYMAEHVSSESKIEPLANNEGASGPKPAAVFGDEIHEMKKNNSITIWKAAIDKMSGDPLMMLGTNTPAMDQPVGTEYSEFFQNILEGRETNDAAFAYIARIDEDDKPFEDESCWIKSLPALDITYPIKNIRSKIRDAEGLPSEFLSIQRLFFGIPVGSAGFWMSEAPWKECIHVVDEEENLNRPVHLSLDLAEKNDLTALSACWEGDVLDVKTWYWTRRYELKKRSSSEKIQYAELEQEGCIEITEGRRIDYAFVAQKISDMCQKFDVVQMAVDSAHLEKLLEKMEEINFPYWTYKGEDEPEGVGLKIISHMQGKNISFDGKRLCMPRSIVQLEDHVLGGTIRIDKNRLTDICASNAVTDSDPMGNKMFDKDKSRSKIDGMVTIAMAVGSATSAMDAKDTSSYLDDGEMVFL